MPLTSEHFIRFDGESASAGTTGEQVDSWRDAERGVMAQGDGLAIRLFGHADISWDGPPLKFAKRATMLAMLAHLVLQRGRAISRESLAFTFFRTWTKLLRWWSYDAICTSQTKSFPSSPVARGFSSMQKRYA